ncbi:hypothetical protein HDU84_004144 [Entophlyctis sp. JEL0112]|nr:hypothetical protein HDU84_004144 [Entophlyctis sp. JEL0112]
MSDRRGYQTQQSSKQEHNSSLGGMVGETWQQAKDAASNAQEHAAQQLESAKSALASAGHQVAQSLRDTKESTSHMMTQSKKAADEAGSKTGRKIEEAYQHAKNSTQESAEHLKPGDRGETHNKPQKPNEEENCREQKGSEDTDKQQKQACQQSQHESEGQHEKGETSQTGHEEKDSTVDELTKKLHKLKLEAEHAQKIADEKMKEYQKATAACVQETKEAATCSIGKKSQELEESRKMAEKEGVSGDLGGGITQRLQETKESIATALGYGGK